MRVDRLAPFSGAGLGTGTSSAIESSEEIGAGVLSSSEGGALSGEGGSGVGRSKTLVRVANEI